MKNFLNRKYPPLFLTSLSILIAITAFFYPKKNTASPIPTKSVTHQKNKDLQPTTLKNNSPKWLNAVALDTTDDKDNQAPIPFPPIQTKQLVYDIATQYLNAFIIEKPKEKTPEEIEKEKKKKVYEVEKPNLAPRELADVLLSKVYPQNTSLNAYVQAKQNIIATMPLNLMKAIRLFQGTVTAPEKSMLSELIRPGASQIEKAAMTIRLATPVTDINFLQKEQAIAQAIAQNPKCFKALKSIYDRIAQEERSLLSLYNKEKDPLFSKPYRKILSDIFYGDTQGKFKNWLFTEGKKRFMLEISIILWIISIYYLSHKLYKLIQGYKNLYDLADFKDINKILAHNENIVGSFRLTANVSFSEFLMRLLSVRKVFLIALYYLGTIIYTLFQIWYPLYQAYKRYRATNDYISNRLGDVQTIFQEAQKIDYIIKNNLPHCADMFAYTQTLLSRKHQNAQINQLSKRFQTCNFKNWSLFFNSSGTLLTTLTLLEENIHALDAMIFEIGQIGTYLSAASLLVNNSTQAKNRFTWPNFINQPHAYIKLKGAWNTAINAQKAVPNDVFIDASKFNTLAVMGPNACGKSQYTQQSTKVPIIAQAGFPVPAQAATLTPFDSFYAFKEPQEDLNIDKSLYAMELEYINEHNAILKMCKVSGQKSLTYYDEFLTSTNPKEASALQCAIIISNTHQYPNNINIISTHNPYLIDFMLHEKKCKLMHVVINRHPDGSYTPTYKVAEGFNDEKVGIDLFQKATGQKKIAKLARELAKHIK
ncbi:MAG: hypothetical protein AAF380_02700 [Bacteroidota bacterium]